MIIQVERIYDDPNGNDTFRILVDRLWPRGLSKDKVKIDLWQKEIAPSNSLRKWFSHDVKKWNEFKARYFKELEKIMNQLTLYLIKLREDQKLYFVGQKMKNLITQWH